MAASQVPILPLDAVDLSVAACLVLFAGLISLGLRLRMERQLAVAAIRTVVQLSLLGYALGWIFGLDHPAPVLVLAAAMIIAAGRAAVARSSRRIAGVQWDALASLTLSGLVTTFVVTGAIIGVEPWYRPQYVVPLLGMVLGNSLTGISLCLDSVLERFDEGRPEIEMWLALGATRWEAARGALRDGVRRGMVPIINTMTVVGIVSLPGMMTGQILAGSSPVEAVRYQIVVMFMLAASSAVGSILVALLIWRRAFNDRHQLRADRIERTGT